MQFATSERKRRYSTDLRGSRGSRESRSFSPRIPTSSSRDSSPTPRRDSLDGPPVPWGPIRQPSPAVVECLPVVLDTSIRATSSNPKLRDWSPAARIAMARTPSSSPVNYASQEVVAAVQVLARVLGPIVLRRIFRRRRQRCWTGSYPPRNYTTELVVSAIMRSTSIFSRWPVEVLHTAASEAAFEFKQPGEPLVYYKESYISSGIVVLLYGKVQEQRKRNQNVIASSERPIHANRVRIHRAPTTLCDVAVLSEDRCGTSFVAMNMVDVAVIPSRWFWEVLYRYIAASPSSCDLVFECFQQVVLPYRTDMLLTTYFPTSVVLQRSWMWPFLSVSDRVKLARTMEVKTFAIGDTLLQEGTYCPYIYILRRGTLSILVKGVPLGVVEPGTSFGEVSVIMGDPRNCTVVANSVAELYALHAEELWHRFNKYPEMVKQIVSKAVAYRRRWMEVGKEREIFGLNVLLQGVPCLSHTTDATRRLLVDKASIYSYPAGYVIAHQGSSCDALYIIGRGSVRMTTVAERRSTSRKTDRPPSVPVPPTAETEDFRSCGDYFGEYCLMPQAWWLRITAETTVDLWRIDKETLRDILTAQSSVTHAMEVCRQGIVLYQARHGGVGGTSSSAPLDDSMDLGRSSSSQRGSRVGSARPPSGSQRSSSRKSVSSISEPAGPPEVNWVVYSLEQSRKMLEKLESDEAAEQQSNRSSYPFAPRHMRELHPADKANEQAMKEKVKKFISVSFQNPHPADCDIPDQIDELQAVIVEQLFLTPTEEQAKFLQQVNDSNVKLVADDDSSSVPVAADDAYAHQLIKETFNGLVEVDPIQSALPLETLPGEGDASPQAIPKLIPEDILSVGSASFTPAAWPQLQTPAHFMSRNPGHEGDSYSSQTIRSSFSRSYFQRPMSALVHGNSPRHLPLSFPDSTMSQARCGSLRAISVDLNATSSSLQNLIGGGGAVPRPVSVDLSYQKKVQAMDSSKSTVALDRFVKVQDQEYFNAFVKVLPIQEQEVLQETEVEVESHSESPRNVTTTPLCPSSKVLILLHVRECQYLDEDELKKCCSPIVKVTIKGTVRLRTPPMPNPKRPEWSIKQASFITFVNRSQHIDFEVCDAANEKETRLYRCSLPVSEFEDRNGVGQRTMRLFPTNGVRKKSGQRTPRLTITMVAILSSQYKTLQNHLLPFLGGPVEELDEMESSPVCDFDANAVVFQVLGIRRLKHRVEAMVVVSLEHDGKISHVLETPRVLPKTRTPSWPGAVANAKVQSDGFLCFDLLHKEVIISSVKIAVDSLVFGGLGVRQFPMLLSKSRSDVIGELQLNVLRTSVNSEMTKDQNEDRVLYLHVEACQLHGDYAMEPDLLVVVRDETGKEVLATPLALGTLQASWTRDAASCFISCPVLAGSSTQYALEVYDGTISLNTRLGGASVFVTRDGLGMENRYDVPFQGSQGRGTIRLTALCLGVTELCRMPEKTKSLRQKIRKSLSPTRDDSDEVLLLVHITGCRDLFHIAQDYCEVDPIVTLSLQDEEILRTPVQEGTSQPSWGIREPSSVLFRLNGAEFASSVLRCEVFDGLVDEAELLSLVEKTVGEICFTGTQEWPLQKGPETALGSTVEPRGCRALGSVLVETVCGRMGEAAFPRGYVSSIAPLPSSDFLREVSSAAPLGDGISTNAEEVASAPFVRCAITNMCQILPRALSKCVEVSVSDSKRVVLSTFRQDMQTDSDVWEWDEAYTCIDTSQPTASSTLEVKVTATLVVEPLASPRPSCSNAAAPATETAAIHKEERQSFETGESVLLGVGSIPAEVIRRIAPLEVVLHTVILKTNEKPAAASPGDSVRHLGRPPTPGKFKAKLSGDYLRPNVTFSLIGMTEPV